MERSVASQMKYGETEPVVIGGMVLDIHATPSAPANPRTTTPGKVHYEVGGVARNVAECMSKLGTKPYMISAVGLDMAGNLLLEHWKSAGLSTGGIQKHQDISTAVVCNIFDTKGEVAAGVASVDSIEKFLTPEWIQQFKGNIRAAPVVMIDANLIPPALEAACKLAAEYNVPVWFEPVSVSKSRRIASIVKYVTFASPNEDELIAMANTLSSRDVFSPIKRDTNGSRCSINHLFQMLKPAICVLLDKGIKIVVVTLGSDGVFLCSKETLSFAINGSRMTNYNGYGGELYKYVFSACPANRHQSATKSSAGSSHITAVHFPSLPASVKRLTGAGDCLVGGTLASMCAGLDVMQSLAVGVAAAKATVEAEANVPSTFNLASVTDDARIVYSGAKVMFHQSML